MDINSLLAQLMGMNGGMGMGQTGGNMTPNQTSGLSPKFIAKPTYDINNMGMNAGMGALSGLTNGMGAMPGAINGMSRGAGAGTQAGSGKNGMPMTSMLGAGANLAQTSGLLPKPISSGLSGASSGATLGSLGGPIGTGIGAGVGGLAGLLGGKGGGGRGQVPQVPQIPLGGY